MIPRKYKIKNNGITQWVSIGFIIPRTPIKILSQVETC